MPTLPLCGDELVEDVVRDFPTASSFLRLRGVVCVQCGEPVWGTITEAIEAKNLPAAELVAALNEHLAEQS